MPAGLYVLSNAYSLWAVSLRSRSDYEPTWAATAYASTRVLSHTCIYVHAHMRGVTLAHAARRVPMHTYMHMYICMRVCMSF